MPDDFRVLVATDGSPSAQAGLSAALAFPWPEPSTAKAVVAVAAKSWIGGTTPLHRSVEAALRAHADVACGLLGARWGKVDVAQIPEEPAAAIVAEARRYRAGALVLGWRGHGTFKRLLAGSVSRKVVARAPCPVLVVRQAPSTFRRFVIGFDGSGGARRAVRFLGRLRPPRASLAVLVNVVEPIIAPGSTRLPASTRARIRAGIAELNERRLDRAQRKIDTAAQGLRRAGWRVRTEVPTGAPLAMLLDVAAGYRADVLLVGARAAGVAERLLVGSVAAGALNSSPIPVMIVP